jgi:putative membrane protein
MLRTTKIVCSLALAAIFTGCQSSEDTAAKPSPTPAEAAPSMMDNTFFKDIALANMTEIQSGQEALNRSKDPLIRQLARHMIDDHTAAQNQLEKLAASKGVELPTELTSSDQTMVDNLRMENGGDFNRDYVNDQVKAHEQAIAEVKKEANDGTDPDAKILAQQLLPTLEHHLEMAKQAQASLSGSGM